MARARAQGGDVLLEEALPEPDEGFLAGASGERYVSEVVVPLVRADPGSAGRTAPRRSGTRRAPFTERVKPVGSDWLYIKLYTEPDAHDALVTGDLAAFAERLTARYGVAEPFFIRYRDPAPHLRVRFHVPDEALREKILGETAQWARTLTTGGRIIEFTFAAYNREIDRYGGTELIGHAERWFQRDSTAATLLLGHLRQAPSEDRVAMTALSLEHMGGCCSPRSKAAAASPGRPPPATSVARSTVRRDARSGRTSPAAVPAAPCSAKPWRSGGPPRLGSRTARPNSERTAWPSPGACCTSIATGWACSATRRRSRSASGVASWTGSPTPRTQRQRHPSTRSQS
ncbi:thiopeptide-type bacteriocin biosynthesis protein [Actinomadura madurae]|nr:thiopeptide-type bacteriocin biosynthesis protein [Actinomadura madurae]